MPSLPLPPLPGGVPLDAGALPVQSQSDVAAEYAQEIRQSQTAPIRDAIQAGQTAMFLEYQKRSRYAAAQSDILRATGEYLDEILSYEHGVHRQPGEVGPAGDVTYRARGLSYPSVVDPNDIIIAANTVLAPFTSISCRYAEASDGKFLNDGTSTWSTHIFDGKVGGIHETPNYPDRLYPDATGAGLTSIPNRRPPGAMPNEDSFGRWFLLRVPDISRIDTTVAAQYDSAPADGSGFFLADGAGPFGGEFLYDFTSTATDVYNALIGAVNAILGQGIRWSLFVDSNLTA